MNPELRRRLYAALERAHHLGMIGGELEDQLAHCASFSSLVAEVCGSAGPATGVDLGTGGGIPGLPLATLWPRCAWTLVDVRAGRIAEVERASVELGLAVDLRTSPAQELGHDPATRERFDIAVARAFGPPSTTAECAAALVRVGGVCLVSEPPETTADRWHAASLRTLGFGELEVVERGGHRFAILRKQHPTPSRVPRRQSRKSSNWYPPEDPATGPRT